jgi:hypothetical protein
LERHHGYRIDAIFAWRYGNVLYYLTVCLLLFIALSGLLIREDLFRARWGFVAVVLALLPALAERATGIRFPWPMKFFLTLALVLHMAGGIFDFYFTLYPIYDKFAHLAAAMGIGFLIFVAILVLGGVTGNNFHRRTVVACVFVGVLLLGLAWEYAELRLDILSGSDYFVNPFDSVFDMIFNLIAVSYLSANLNEYLKRETLLDLYRRWIHWKGDERKPGKNGG